MTHTLTVGSLFSGYLGLTMAVEVAFDARLAWVSDIKAYNKKGTQVGDAPLILEHRAPGVPNLGDITAVDWTRVEPVDIIDGGSPCQDISTAGRRQGMTTGTRSNLWVAMRDAIATIKPAFVVWENVRGALSARADSDMERCPGCVGDNRDLTHLRALGRVLGDLADLGFDAEWRGLRAADIGAPHGRHRIFVVAAHPDRVARLQRRPPVTRDETSGWAFGGAARRDSAPVTLLPTPAASRYGSNRSASPGAQVRPSLDSIGDLLPTPRSADGLACPGSPAAARHVQAGNGSLAEVLGVALLPTPTTQPGTGNGSLAEVLGVALLPTPTTQPGTGNGHARNLPAELIHTPSVADRYGKYAPTVARWETILGRHAPPALIPGTRKLNPAFVEWMMGLPAGWVTDIPGLTRPQLLHALGNGVVPQQALAAITDCLTALTDRTAT